MVSHSFIRDHFHHMGRNDAKSCASSTTLTHDRDPCMRKQAPRKFTWTGSERWGGGYKYKVITQYKYTAVTPQLQVNPGSEFNESGGHVDNCGFLSGQELLRCCYLKKPASSPVINASCTSVHVDIKRSRDLPGFTRSSQLKAKVHQYISLFKAKK